MNELEIRFLEKVLKTKDCWIWVGSRKSSGYGCFWYNGKVWTAHRFSLYFFKNLDVQGKVVCHSCDNRYCVNPDHLWIGTQKDNVHDMIKKNKHYKSFENLKNRVMKT